MYEARADLTDSHDLQQGDLLLDLLLPQAPVGTNLVPVRGKKQLVWPIKPEHLQDADLRAVCPVKRVGLTIVLSNSCDNFGDYPVQIAPADPFEFEQPDAADQWAEISHAATGTSAPKYFYLPASPTFGVARSQVSFPDLFTLQHEYIQRCISDGGLRRACGLTQEGQRHLQWALGLYYSRNAREDDAWPSDEDLTLKIAWLQREIERNAPRRKAYEDQLRNLRARLGK